MCTCSGKVIYGRQGNASDFGYKVVEIYGYCSDYVYPSTGTQVGTYDDEEDDADSCKTKCLAVLPESTSFYITREKKCGCSLTTSGACDVTYLYDRYDVTYENQVVYEIVSGDAVWGYLQNFDYKA